jgi:acyl-CoA synthetase (NDP forming)
MTELYDQIDAIFHPKNIAFVGIPLSNPSHWTRTFWNSIRIFNFEGGLYPVNPRGGELDGHKVYTSLDEAPGNIDYAIVTVAARTAPAIVKKCAARGIKAIHICTAGFAETGEKVVAGLQDEIAKIAHDTGIRVIGPNCMGLYSPESRISWGIDFSREQGHVGLISQSGSNANIFIHEANWRGVRFSKVVSFGNACDLNESDFLEYMIDDPQTSIIALYLEGVKDGARLFRLMKKASQKKPVVLLKLGMGTAGARATATHTASLAGNNTIWDAFCRQINIMRPSNIQQMVDLLVTLSFVPDPGGRNVAIIGGGGGATVLSADEFESRGFHLPLLPVHLQEELLSFSQAEGNMLNNPIDISQSMNTPGSIERAIKLLMDWKDVAFCVSFFCPSQLSEASFMNALDRKLPINTSMAATDKPIVTILEEGRLPDRSNAIYQLRQSIVQSGRAVYYRFADAADALKMVIDYNEHKPAKR